jgi:hypothetical protein
MPATAGAPSSRGRRIVKGMSHRSGHHLRMSAALDLAPWLAVAAVAAGAWLGHRLLGFLERRGWVYYLGRDA